VSGDFYWATSIQTSHANALSLSQPHSENGKYSEKDHSSMHELFYLAVCDSTGHGVPGAFMSLLNMGFLNEAIREKNILAPNAIFDYIRLRLEQSVSKEGQKDGMDGVLICLDRGNKILSYAAANNAPIWISSGRIQDTAKNKMPVGQSEKTDSFSLFTIPYAPGDLIYLFTDGFADQFGGPKGKKFKFKQLEQLLIEMHHLPVDDQKIHLSKVFQSWRGDLEQVDDVCIFGLKL
jgi:serine phosphatase RsbU (regulator of sigma subunit)